MRITLIALLVFILLPMTAPASSIRNDCVGWATYLRKEGRVRDSVHMKMLGCDDGPRANAHYRADVGVCATEARKITRRDFSPYGNQYTMFVSRPKTVAVLVMAANPSCYVMEDGSYGLRSYTT